MKKKIATKVNNKHQNVSNPEDENGKTDYFFSFAGTYNRTDYWSIMVAIYLLINYTSKLNIVYLNISMYLMMLYVFLITVQKRCRDMNIKGTLFIFLFSFTFPVMCYFTYFKTLMDSANKYIFVINLIIYFVLQLILIFYPGAKRKDITLISPLLKHRYIYTAVCFALYLLGYYTLAAKVM